MPGVTVGEGKSFQPRTSAAIPEQERMFCERTAGGQGRVTNVAIQVPHLGAKVEALPRPVCRRPRGEAWWPLLCGPEGPERMEIFGIYLLDAGRYDQHAFPDFRVDPRIGEAQPLDPRWERVGPLARLDMGHVIYWRGPRMAGAASPWSGRCYQNRGPASEPDGWRCKAGYLLTPRIALVYDFVTPRDDFVPAALRVEERVSRIASSLVIDERTVPRRQ